MLSGLLCDERLWQHQVAALSMEMDIFLADLTLDTSIEAMARRVLNNAPEKFSLAALSMGGYVAFEIMCQAPERVSRLALIDTMASPDTPEKRQIRQDLLSLAEIGKFKGVTPRLLPKLVHPRCIATPVSHLGRPSPLRARSRDSTATCARASTTHCTAVRASRRRPCGRSGHCC